MTDARVILNCKYFKKGSTNKATIKNLVKYISTREGVEISLKDESKNLPTSDNQFKLIKTLEESFGIDYSLPEFEDFAKAKNQGAASAYISAMLDNNLHKALTKKNLVEYIGKRPGAVHDEQSDHGLFCISDNGEVVSDVNLDAVMDEVSNHPGRVWTNVLSLRREDAVAANFENREAWMNLFRSNIITLSEQMNIPLTNLKAYGAFHNEGHHPHCHFIVYSSHPKNESLYPAGIKRLKSAFAHGIFTKPIREIVSGKSLVRDELRARSREDIKALADKLADKGFVVSSELEVRLVNLARKLPKRGKKSYAFLSADLKLDVDKIVDLIAKEPEITELYDKWKEYQAELNRFYKIDNVDNFPALSENEAFRPVLNSVVREAWAIRQWLDTHPGVIPKQEAQSAFDIERYYNDEDTPDYIKSAYINILSDFSRCFGGRGIINAYQKHFDVTMDKKHQQEQRELKKRLGITV